MSGLRNCMYFPKWQGSVKEPVRTRSLFMLSSSMVFDLWLLKFSRDAFQCLKPGRFSQLATTHVNFYYVILFTVTALSIDIIHRLSVECLYLGARALLLTFVKISFFCSNYTTLVNQVFKQNNYVDGYKI